MLESTASRVIAGTAIVLLSFYGTLLVLDYEKPRRRNDVRAEHTRLIKGGLNAYFKAHNSYPGPADIPAGNLSRFLVEEGFVPKIPSEPLPGAVGYQYNSDGKTYYGLIVRLEPVTTPWGSTKGGACLTGLRTETTRVFGDPPLRNCPF